MGDWIGLGIIVLVLAGALWGMSHLGKTPEPLSDEEFARRAAEARGTMSAGVAGVMYALQKLMNPKAAEAVEVQKDLGCGFYDVEELPGGSQEPKQLSGDEEPVARKQAEELTTEEEGDDA